MRILGIDLIKQVYVEKNASLENKVFSPCLNNENKSNIFKTVFRIVCVNELHKTLVINCDHEYSRDVDVLKTDINFIKLFFCTEFEEVI